MSYKKKWRIGMIVFIVGLLVLLGAAAGSASTWDGYTEWDQQRGIDSIECDYENGGEFRDTEEGWMHWVVVQAGSVTDAELVLGGSGKGYTVRFPEDERATQQGNNLQFFTPYFDLVEGELIFDENGKPIGDIILTATLYFNGQQQTGHITLSDYCPGIQYATKSGYKFHDLNANGEWDEGEPALSGWTINLWTEVDGELAIVETDTTDEYGYYEFDELMPGVDYYVSEVIEDGWIQSYPNQDNVDDEEAVFIPGVGFVWGPINLESGEVEEDNNFGNYRPAVWADETAWAYGGEFANPNWDYVNNRFWGWTNGPLTEGEYEWDIYAGAGQNNLNNGYVVGKLYVNYEDGCVTVTYQLDSGYYLGETHLWVGDDVLPMVNQGRREVYTNAPGQFPYGEYIGFEAGVKMVNEWTWSMDGFEGEIYVAAHSVVWMEVEYEEW